MKHENNISLIYLKGTQVSFGVKQHVEAINENPEVKEIGMWKIVKVQLLSNQREFSGIRQLLETSKDRFEGQLTVVIS